MKLSHEEVKKVIPHRDPMLLVDTVEEMDPGNSIVTKFYVDPSREIFQGHFPGEPVLPGVYSVECMAQAADVLLLSAERYAGTHRHHAACILEPAGYANNQLFSADSITAELTLLCMTCQPFTASLWYRLSSEFPGC